MYQEMARDIAAAPPEPTVETAAEWAITRASEQARRAAKASHVSGRRRNVDPTTTDRDYSPEELEFLKAMQDYKRRSGRMFPTWSEVLEVLRSLGYEKSGVAAEDNLVGPSSSGRVAR